MGPPTISTSEGSQKKSKKPKFLTNGSLMESFVRSDEVSSETVRINVEKSFGSFSDSQGRHHVVQDYLHLFDIHNMESYSVNPSNFLENFYSIINHLNNGALCLVANLVTDDKVRFKKICPIMIKIIKDHLPKVLAESDYKDSLTPLKQLSQIFRDPSNFREKQLTLLTPVSPSLLSSIHKALEGLDEMPFQDLIAMNKKLRDVTLVPQFPPVLSACKRDLLIERVKKRCQKILSTLKEGADLPKPFAKALSVLCLSLKLKTRCVDILTSEFYPFSPDIVGLQNDILQALWSLPKVRIDELKALQPLVDPKAKIPRKSFRTALRKYLMEYLFECDMIDIPEEVLSTLAFLNRRSRRQPRLCEIETIDEEVETVLNLSSQLKQIVLNLLQDDRINEKSEGLGSDDDSEINDFELAENDYCSNPDVQEQQEMYSCCVKDEGEITGDSRPFTSTTNGSYSLQLTEAYRIGDFIKKQPKLEQDDDINLPHHCPEEAIELQPKNTVQETGNMREVSIQEICDETSLVAYKLIGSMLDKFLQIEGRDADEMTRYYLRGGCSPPLDSPGTEDSLNTSKEDVGAQILIQAVEELLPTMPKSCLERVKMLMGQPQL